MKPQPLGLLLAIAAFVGLAWATWFVCDDAFISYRYAWHWAHGNGIRFNLGEGRPVEGYSDFLWVAIAAAGELVGLRPFQLMPSVSILCGVGLLVLVERMARNQLGVRPEVSWAVALLLAVCPPFFVWGTSGLEGMAHAFTWTLAFYALGPASARWAPALGAVALLASMLLRAEGFAWGGGVLLAAGLARWGQGRRVTEGWRAPLVAAFLAYAAYQGWRWDYYGKPFPNTVYAKVDPSTAVFQRGALYVLGFFVSLATPLLLVAAVPAALRGERWRRSLPIVVLAGGPMAFATVVGGDFMTFWRLLVPSLAPLALLAAPALDDLARRSGRLMLAVVLLVGIVGALPAADVHVFPKPVRMAFDVRGPWPNLSEIEKWLSMRNSAQTWFVEGVALREVTEPGDSIVLGAIGATGYAAPELNIFDIYGLVTPEVSRREIKPRDLTTPGHDKEVRLTFFYEDRPALLGYRLFRPEDLKVELEEVVKVMSKRDPRNVYVPDLRKVELLSEPRCPILALTLRHYEDKEERRVARAAFVEARERLAGSATNCAKVERVREYFPQLSRLPVGGGRDPKVTQAREEPKGKAEAPGKGGRDGKGDGKGDGRDGRR